MPDELLTIFKLCFLVLLYLFFFRVLRAVWTEVNAPAPQRVAAEGDIPARVSRRKAKAAAAAMPAPGPGPKRSRSDSTSRDSARALPTRLIAVDPAHLAGLEYPLVDGMSIGRGSAASIVLEDSFLSQRHCSFDVRDGAWSVTDLGSTNGTYVNRTRVDQMTLLHLGDQVQVGNVILEVR